MEQAMSLCWYSEADESTVALKVRLLLALDDFLFEDLPRYGSLLSIWAGRWCCLVFVARLSLHHPTPMLTSSPSLGSEGSFHHSKPSD
jgi:hypothetical protein